MLLQRLGRECVVLFVSCTSVLLMFTFGTDALDRKNGLEFVRFSCTTHDVVVVKCLYS